MNGFEMILPLLKPIEHVILDDTISDVMAPARGGDPEEVIRRIADYRGDHKHSGYARYTLEKAKAEIEREGRAGNCRAGDRAIPESEITTDRMEIR